MLGTFLLYLRAHLAQIGFGLGVWAMVASALNRVPWLTPAPGASKFLKGLHTFLIDWPSFLPKIDFKGTFGLPITIPYLTISRQPAPPTVIP